MVTTLDKKAVVSPTQVATAGSPRGFKVFTLALTIAALLTVALGASVIFGAGATDASSEVAEERRMMVLAPGAATDRSYESAEATRMNGLAPQTATDGSYESAEATRMSALVPAIDGSSERAEQERHQRLGGGGGD